MCQYLGLDLSTQKLKAVVLNNELDIITSAEVRFDTDLPEYRTTGGVNSIPNENEFFANPVMWVKAIDIILERLIMQGAEFSKISCISGAAQQHGSVYWSAHGIKILKNLNADKFLHLQLDETAFSINRTPIWMDSSTTRQCLEMEIAIGGCNEMVSITGSKCYPRFTGPQIRKLYQKRANAYENTERISLISSFLASVFLGEVAPIDFSDASGMNLFNIEEKVWSKLCLNSCAPDLIKKLEKPVPTNYIIGNISEYYQKRFGFENTCRIAAFTGDNPSALSGMLADENSIILSLGTSDTVMMNLQKHPKFEEGHVFCHPTENELFMGLLCFRNGSLIRDGVKRTEANDSWKTFNELLDSTPRGNFGNVAVHFKEREIIPAVKGVLKWTKEISSSSKNASIGIKRFSSPQIEIRALIEGQILHHKIVVEDMGFHFGEETIIIATGGASINKSILQVVADVFNVPVFVQTNIEAALMGAAYRAKYALYLDSQKHDSLNEVLRFQDYIKKFVTNHLRMECSPSMDSVKIYQPMLDRYRQMCRCLLENQGQ